MNEWWKDPRLDDEGTYDYLIEKLPSNYVKWQYDKYPGRCDSCGKERRLALYSVDYFYTLDGWDSLDATECWKCNLRDKIWSIKRKIKQNIATFKLARELYKENPTRTFKHYYELAKKIVR